MGALQMERKHQCKRCGKRFVFEANLDRHEVGGLWCLAWLQDEPIIDLTKSKKPD